MALSKLINCFLSFFMEDPAIALINSTNEILKQAKALLNQIQEIIQEIIQEEEDVSEEEDDYLPPKKR